MTNSKYAHLLIHNLVDGNERQRGEDELSSALDWAYAPSVREFPQGDDARKNDFRNTARRRRIFLTNPLDDATEVVCRVHGPADPHLRVEYLLDPANNLVVFE